MMHASENVILDGTIASLLTLLALLCLLLTLYNLELLRGLSGHVLAQRMWSPYIHLHIYIYMSLDHQVTWLMIF